MRTKSGGEGNHLEPREGRKLEIPMQGVGFGGSVSKDS